MIEWMFPRTGVSIATVQAAIVSRFPDAAAATPDRTRVFAFVVGSAGNIKQAHVDTSVARADTTAASAERGEVSAVHSLSGTVNPANISSMHILKHVPLGSDSVSVVWLVQQ